MNIELEKLINRYKNKKKNGLITAIRYNKELQDLLFEETKFLDNSYNISARIFCLLNNIYNTPMCLCGKPLKFLKINRGFHKTCGNKKCTSKIRSINYDKMSNKINSKETRDKIEKTNIIKYGGKCNFSKGTKSREKYDEIIEEKYGSKYALQNKEILEKQKNTTIEKFGTLNMLGLEKVKNTMLSKYGSKYPIQNKKIQNIIVDKTKTIKWSRILDRLKYINCEIVSFDNVQYYILKCNKCGRILTKVTRHLINFTYRNNTSPCHHCYPNLHFRSNFEKNIAEELLKFCKEELQYNRKYLGAEVDILVPTKNIAIECNGVYWHSELYKDKNYHIDKKKLIEDNGYNLIQIWEDDWLNEKKKQIIINRLKVKLGYGKKIYARKCQIQLVNGKDTKSFMDLYHLHKYTTSSINLGLYYNNELISMCTFSKTRKTIGGNREGWELIRNVTKNDYIVIGGFDKLINYFTKNYSSELHSYVDCDWSNIINNSYNNKFKLIKQTDPGYWWCVDGIRENRLKYTKKILINNGADSNLTEVEIMSDLGYVRIWNSGNLLYQYKK